MILIKGKNSIDAKKRLYEVLCEFRFYPTVFLSFYKGGSMQLGLKNANIFSK